MTELGAWLTKIWDEDEARLSAPTFCGPVWPTTNQLLARIAADRQILEAWKAAKVRSDEWASDEDDPAELSGITAGLRQALLITATAYADRPGYLEEGRP